MLERPRPVARIAEIMQPFRASWALCGGWAVDAWLGRETRTHEDLDLSVFEADQRAIFDHLAGSWSLVGHDRNVPAATAEPWNGRPLDLPAHIHAHSDNEPFELEVFLDDRFADEWVLRRVPWLGVRIDHAVRPSAWGVPTAAAEVLLFLKATSHVRELRQGPRPRDEDDFRALLPQLQRPQIEWLKGAISSVQPGHRWIEQLEP